MRKYLNFSAFALALFLILLLAACLVSLISGFLPYLGDSADISAYQRMDSLQSAVEEQIDVQFDNLAGLTDTLTRSESHEAVVQYMESYIGSEQFGDLQFVCSGVTYSESGSEMTEGPALGITTGSQRAISQMEYYPLGQTQCVALYLPVRGSLYVDGLISVIPASQLLDLEAIREPTSQLIAVVSTRGDTLGWAAAPDFEKTVGRNFLNFFKDFSQNKDSAIELKNMLESTYQRTAQLTVAGAPYTVTTSPLGESGGNLVAVDLSPTVQTVSRQKSYLEQVIVISVLAIAALVLSALYMAMGKSRRKNAPGPEAEKMPAPAAAPAAAQEGHVDTRVAPATAQAQALPAHGCRNPEQFRSQVDALLRQSGRQNRYLFCAEIRDFARIQDRLGPDGVNSAIFHVEKVLSSMGKDGEYFCYGGEGCFYICGRCRDQEDLTTRCQLLKDLAAQHKGKLGLRIGACPMGLKGNATVREMMQNAALAKNMIHSNVTAPFLLYSEELVAEHRNNQQIERQMEDALKTGEFKLFLQPKYSVKDDAMDSAEALVRWFDPRKNDYIFPAKFLPLFESNGFVTKLDHFMYLEVLKYYEAAAEKGEKAYPISVNVSRVTALQPDFLNFYVSKKKLYGVKDHMLTLEFMESFAAQNLEFMEKIIPQLRECGIRVAIDNLGSGSGALKILKKLPVDEINIDRSFLFPGVSRDRDLSLQKALVASAKAFGIRVVQSGVENKGLFDSSCGAGCDVIQGYYFARAISLEEYRIFIRTNTSIRYKAVVK